MGKELFGGMQYHEHGVGVTEYANFNYFHTALLTVFRISTNDSWRVLMEDCGKKDQMAASIFFPAVVVTMNFFFLNLFIS
eukprot:6867443-Prymnesium_polylepis.1